MREPLLVKLIYAELRETIGAELGKGAALRLAHLILEANKTYFASDELQVEPEVDLPFHARPVDEAMGDGGWKILNFEVPKTLQSETLPYTARTYQRSRLKGLMGTEWRRHLAPG